MKKGKKKSGLITFTPQLQADDNVANYWMRQAAIRLRREVCWRWQEQGLQPAERTAVLPPFTDKAAAALDLSRFWEEKKKFYEIDPTAQYLTKQLQAKPPQARGARQGSFGWVVDKLQLDSVGAFALALVLAAAFDSSMGS